MVQGSISKVETVARVLIAARITQHRCQSGLVQRLPWDRPADSSTRLIIPSYSFFIKFSGCISLVCDGGIALNAPF